MYFASTFVVLLLGVRIAEGIVGQSESHEARLLKDLLGNYNTQVRPVIDYNDTVMVKMEVILRRVHKLCSKSHVLKTSMWLSQSWTDDFLKWNPEDYGGIQSVYADKANIFIPDLTVWNSVGPFEPSSQINKAILHHTGTVIAVDSLEIKTDCVFNHTQTEVECPIKIGSWVYNMKRLDLEPEKVDRHFFVQNSKWNLGDVVMSREEKKYPCCPDDKYPNIKLNMKFTKAEEDKDSSEEE